MALPGTAHGRLFGDHWDVSPERVVKWWPFATAAAAPPEGYNASGDGDAGDAAEPEPVVVAGGQEIKETISTPSAVAAVIMDMITIW